MYSFLHNIQYSKYLIQSQNAGFSCMPIEEEILWRKKKERTETNEQLEDEFRNSHDEPSIAMIEIEPKKQN